MLFKKVSEIDREQLPRTNGVYLFRLNDSASLYGFENTNYCRIVYVGRAINSNTLYSRFGKHIESSSKQTSSSGSTFRRSLGAVLKNELKLIAYPRRLINKKSEINNYNFILPGKDFTNENILTDWMKENLEYCFIESDNAEEFEKDLEKTIKPTLNDTKHNPLQSKLFGRDESLRKICRKEAEKFLEGT